MSSLDIAPGQETPQQLKENLLCLAMCAETNLAFAEHPETTAFERCMHQSAGWSAEEALRMEVMAQRQELEVISDQPS